MRIEAAQPGNAEIIHASAPWNLKTTARNPNLLRDVRARRDEDVSQLEEIIGALEEEAEKIGS